MGPRSTLARGGGACGGPVVGLPHALPVSYLTITLVPVLIGHFREYYLPVAVPCTEQLTDQGVPCGSPQLGSIGLGPGPPGFFLLLLLDDHTDRPLPCTHPSLQPSPPSGSTAYLYLPAHPQPVVDFSRRQCLGSWHHTTCHEHDGAPHAGLMGWISQPLKSETRHHTSRIPPPSLVGTCHGSP